MEGVGEGHEKGDGDLPIIDTCRYRLDLPYDQHPFNHPSKDAMFPIEEFSRG